MKAIDVPIALYNEFSQQFGMRKGAKKITRNKTIYSMIRNLDYERRSVDFPGAIGLMMKRDNPDLRYWSAMILWAKVDPILNPSDEILVIGSEPAIAGNFVSGLGFKYKNIVVFHSLGNSVGMYGVNLVTSWLPLVCKIIQRGYELSQLIEEEFYWQRDLYPDTDYIRPPEHFDEQGNALIPWSHL